MSCRIDRELYELICCGCKQCQEQYENIMYRRRRVLERNNWLDGDWGMPPRVEHTPAGLVSVPNKALVTAVDYVKEKPVEEPKNLAVKMLVDKLKAEQSRLSSTQTTIDSFKKSLGEYNKQKLATQKNIKELSDALKKLGHKDA